MTFTDDFTRPDGGLGAPWSTLAGSFGIVSNTARHTGPLAYPGAPSWPGVPYVVPSVAVVDVGSADMVVEWERSAGSGGLWCPFRVASDDSMLAVGASSTALDQVYLVRIEPSGAGSASAHAAAVNADSPEAFWRLDEASGTLADDTGNGHTGTAGGVGVSSSITGTALFYAGGGGGGALNFYAESVAGGLGGSGVGGTGGRRWPGGNVVNATAPTPNRGGGGGGGGNGFASATAGAAGVVIVRYLL